MSVFNNDIKISLKQNLILANAVLVNLKKDLFIDFASNCYMFANNLAKFARYWGLGYSLS